MKKFIVLSLLSMLIASFASADFILIEKPSEIFLSKNKNFTFEHIDFRILKNKNIMSYAVVNEAGKSKAVKALLYSSHSWDYEDRFKTSEVDYFGSLGSDRIIILKNGDIHTTYHKENKTRWLQHPINFRKYNQETVTSCSGTSSNRFWITVYNNTTKEKKVFELIQNHDNNTHALNESPYIDVSITPNLMYGWFINKDRSLIIRELDDEELEFATKVMLQKTIPPIKSLVAYDETTAYIIDYAGNLYQIDIAENQESVNIKTIETSSRFSISCIGFAGGKLIAAHKDRLYQYEYKKIAPQVIKSGKKETVYPEDNPSKKNLADNLQEKEIHNQKELPKEDTDIKEVKKNAMTKSEEINKSTQNVMPQTPIEPSKESKSAVITQVQPAFTLSKAPRTVIKNQNQSNIQDEMKQKLYLSSLLKSPLFQKMLKHSIKNPIVKSFYNKFLRNKQPFEIEKEALEKDPYPWNTYAIKKPTYYEQAQDWLYNQSNGFLGKKIIPSTDFYFPLDDKQARRAQFLRILYLKNKELMGTEEKDDKKNPYQAQWLIPKQWEELSNEIKILLQSANNGKLPEYGEFWLQERPQHAIKELPAQQKLHIEGAQ